jgi:hypothetical protein
MLLLVSLQNLLVRCCTDALFVPVVAAAMLLRLCENRVVLLQRTLHKLLARGTDGSLTVHVCLLTLLHGVLCTLFEDAYKPAFADFLFVMQASRCSVCL